MKVSSGMSSLQRPSLATMGRRQAHLPGAARPPPTAGPPSLACALSPHSSKPYAALAVLVQRQFGHCGLNGFRSPGVNYSTCQRRASRGFSARFYAVKP